MILFLPTLPLTSPALSHAVTTDYERLSAIPVVILAIVFADNGAVIPICVPQYCGCFSHEHKALSSHQHHSRCHRRLRAYQATLTLAALRFDLVKNFQPSL